MMGDGVLFSFMRTEGLYQIQVKLPPAGQWESAGKVRAKNELEAVELAQKAGLIPASALEAKASSVPDVEDLRRAIGGA
jgi:hypothetical protein